MYQLKDLIFFPDDLTRKKLADLLRKPANEIPTDALRLAADILDGSVKFKPSPLIKNKENQKKRDAYLHHMMYFYIGLGLPAYNVDKCTKENPAIDAAFIVSSYLPYSPTVLSGARAIGRRKTYDAFSKLGGTKNDGKNMMVKNISNDWFQEGSIILKFHSNIKPKTEEDTLKMIKHWQAAEKEKGREAFFMIDD